MGSGKTATDACVWLLGNGVDPDSICWVRPRDPWMLNRAMVQPNPAVFIGMGADTDGGGGRAATPDGLFLELEERGVMLRVDRSVTPTMAKTPTLAVWELDLLRTIDNVVRRGHLDRVEQGRLVFGDGQVEVAEDAVVVHCAAPGLRYPPLVPIWGADAIRLQPIRTGFPCFGAALAGFAEATFDDDAEKNRLCPPSPSPTPRRTGAGCRCWAGGRRWRCPAAPRSRSGPTGWPSTHSRSPGDGGRPRPGRRHRPLQGGGRSCAGQDGRAGRGVGLAGRTVDQEQVAGLAVERLADRGEGGEPDRLGALVLSTLRLTIETPIASARAVSVMPRASSRSSSRQTTRCGSSTGIRPGPRCRAAARCRSGTPRR